MEGQRNSKHHSSLGFSRRLNHSHRSHGNDKLERASFQRHRSNDGVVTCRGEAMVRPAVLKRRMSEPRRSNHRMRPHLLSPFLAPVTTPEELENREWVIAQVSEDLEDQRSSQEVAVEFPSSNGWCIEADGGSTVLKEGKPCDSTLHTATDSWMSYPSLSSDYSDGKSTIIDFVPVVQDELSRTYCI